MPEEVYKKAELYDIISYQQDFKKQSDFIVQMAKKFGRPKGKYLLNVGCGTGRHDVFLKKTFEVMGIDLNKNMLKLAKRRNKEVTYKIGNMRHFRLNKRFDILTALTGVMSYNYTYKELKTTIRNLYNHLLKGGVLIFNWEVAKEVAFERGKQRNYVSVRAFSINDSDYVLINNAYDADRKDTMMESHLLLLARKKRGPMTTVIDKHRQGLFELRKVRKILRAVGFRYRLYENDFSGGTYKLRGPIFVCVKQARDHREQSRKILGRAFAGRA